MNTALLVWESKEMCASTKYFHSYLQTPFLSLCFVLITVQAAIICKGQNWSCLAEEPQSFPTCRKEKEWGGSIKLRGLFKPTCEKKHLKAVCGPGCFINSRSLLILIYKSWRSLLKCPLKSPPVFITTHLPGAHDGDRLGGLSYSENKEATQDTPLLPPGILHVTSTTPRTKVFWVSMCKDKMHCLEKPHPSYASRI